jgi:hypothetical protein
LEEVGVARREEPSPSSIPLDIINDRIRDPDIRQSRGS